MIGDATLFVKLKAKNSGKIIFGDVMKTKPIDIGDVGKDGETLIHNVLLVDGLSYNLLSVSQLCDRNLFIFFKKNICLILNSEYNVVFKCKRYNYIYVAYLECSDHSKFKCLSVTCNDPWIWHRRFCHFNVDVLNKVSKKELVRGLSKLKFFKDHICDACQFGKTEQSFL